ncbi:MAG: prepilin-type N-terminal cleavage/methylation domain-containing protein [Lachnospiraceae bacterium]|nr:prepilin-type N-terminal cleavage/methylation domain-containing protein [Lachnospiraceae bacterium]
MEKKKMNDKGFSLVELIIVIAIMAVLVGILAPQYLKYVQSSRVSTDITNAEEIATSVSVAIADGDITLPASGTITVDADDISNVDAFPASKVSASYTWEVTVGELGVSKITLGGAEIWPDSTAYESAN